jgi:hypothetical protein
MRKIANLLILSCLVFSCKTSDNRIKADIADIRKVEIIQCYSLEEIYNGFLKFNDFLKKDSSRLNLHQSSGNNLIQQINEDISLNNFPLFTFFKPFGYFDGQIMTYIKSSFLGVIGNKNKDILMTQLSDDLIKDGFPTNINFFYIPSPFIDTMSVLIGSKTKNFSRDIKTGDFSAFGFQKIKSYDLNGKLIDEGKDVKSFMPYIVFKESGKGIISSGEYLLKLTLKDTVVYKSLDRFDLKNDTIFFENLFTGKYINDRIK